MANKHLGYHVMRLLAKCHCFKSWDELDIEIIAVDTGIQDFAENHDHYLYRTPKQF